MEGSWWQQHTRGCKDVLLLSFAHLSPRMLALCQWVCRLWRDVAGNQILWEDHCRRRWPAMVIPNQRKPLNFRALWGHRIGAMRVTGADMAIENCASQLFEFKCPYMWSQLQRIGGLYSDKVRACNVCQRNVYMCESVDEFQKRTEGGDCVALSFKWVRHGGHFTLMGEGSDSKDATLMMQLLRDNLFLWQGDATKEEETTTI